MAEDLARIGRIASAEAALPKPSPDATVWETEELTLRYVLEDGKLNLCVKLQDDFAIAWLQAGQVFTDAQRSNFESGIGNLLCAAWSHCEAVQSANMDTLVHSLAMICADALRHLGSSDDSPPAQQHPLWALACVQACSVGKFIDTLDGDRFVHLFASSGLLAAALQLCFHAQHAAIGLSPAQQQQCAEHLGILLGSEAFAAQKAEWLSSPAVVTALKSIERARVKSNMALSSEARQRIRPVHDLLLVASRK